MSGFLVLRYRKGRLLRPAEQAKVSCRLSKELHHTQHTHENEEPENSVAESPQTKIPSEPLSRMEENTRDTESGQFQRVALLVSSRKTPVRVVSLQVLQDSCSFKCIATQENSHPAFLHTLIFC